MAVGKATDLVEGVAPQENNAATTFPWKAVEQSGHIAIRDFDDQSACAETNTVHTTAKFGEDRHEWTGITKKANPNYTPQHGVGLANANGMTHALVQSPEVPHNSALTMLQVAMTMLVLMDRSCEKIVRSHGFRLT